MARRDGVFVADNIADAVEGICRATARNQSSMLQDVRAGRRTEIDQINGEIARRADAHGVPAPLCRALTALVHGLEAREEVRMIVIAGEQSDARLGGRRSSAVMPSSSPTWPRQVAAGADTWTATSVSGTRGRACAAAGWS